MHTVRRKVLIIRGTVYRSRMPEDDVNDSCNFDRLTRVVANHTWIAQTMTVEHGGGSYAAMIVSQGAKDAPLEGTLQRVDRGWMAMEGWDCWIRQNGWGRRTGEQWAADDALDMCQYLGGEMPQGTITDISSGKILGIF